MRDIHRNPILYYLGIPLLIGLWPLLVWAVYLPAAEKGCDQDYSLLIEGQTHIMGILEIDPQRTIRDVDPNHVVREFAYDVAVPQMANRCGIPAGNCEFGGGSIVNFSGKQRRDGNVHLKDISIVQAARFLSMMQATYVNLQCDKIQLTKRKDLPDKWVVDLDFIYYY
jgi:hypothetical protein